MSVKSLYQEYQREKAEHKELSHAKVKEREKKRVFEDQLRLKRSQEREAQIRKSTVRTQALAGQKAREREASQQRAKSSAALRHERFESIKQTVKPYFKPVVLGGTALRGIARGGVTKFYVLGSKPKTPSPSYNILYQNFEHQPFTVEQAVEVIANTRQTGYGDAYNRLKLMKQYGMIREGV